MRRGVQIRYSTRVGKEGPSYLEGMGTALLAALDAEVHLGRRPSGGSSPLPFKSATGYHINEMRCDANFMPNLVNFAGAVLCEHLFPPRNMPSLETR